MWETEVIEKDYFKLLFKGNLQTTVSWVYLVVFFLVFVQ